MDDGSVGTLDRHGFMVLAVSGTPKAPIYGLNNFLPARSGWVVQEAWDINN